LPANEEPVNLFPSSANGGFLLFFQKFEDGGENNYFGVKIYNKNADVLNEKILFREKIPENP